MKATWSLVAAKYHPSESQIITLAVDGHLAYWEALDGTEIRSLVLGKHSTLTAMDISTDGETFVTGTNSSLVKVY